MYVYSWKSKKNLKEFFLVFSNVYINYKFITISIVIIYIIYIYIYSIYIYIYILYIILNNLTDISKILIV